ncbi:PREDICTED: uncharacterized protein LOC105559244 [Vollenhovia emeryi]|uniref:uncharacterized protein LOC105559244 n=1 Tax=Vollenhovia emeryi TaxID=411798 RepID=UPI0005F56EE3|nr:PREDICTED: uncharacterized protein LOC105559244 [Vollenhovia emeryi]
MPLRAIIRYLTLRYLNNENVINRLAESKPMRQAAQFVVSILIRTGMINGTRRSISSPQEFIQQLKNIADQLKRQLEQKK